MLPSKVPNDTSRRASRLGKFKVTTRGFQRHMAFPGFVRHPLVFVHGSSCPNQFYVAAVPHKQSGGVSGLPLPDTPAWSVLRTRPSEFAVPVNVAKEFFLGGVCLDDSLMLD